ncbi:Uu.00g014190.m01.CDS01 [Anthostomella pinea]|uniref:Uu.00g014190.m01.CDS01 n=1 Tax=Anthostomella pinea TaxID=933095 RepID=A0AAI8VYV7_9PEZI|nr:Uu.00g014190.m01.CDS01 [Anthostomella pinea]
MLRKRLQVEILQGRSLVSLIQVHPEHEYPSDKEEEPIKNLVISDQPLVPIGNFCKDDCKNSDLMRIILGTVAAEKRPAFEYIIRNLDKIMACAPTHLAVRTLAQRVSQMNKMVVDSYNERHGRSSSATILHATDEDTNLAAFIRKAKHGASSDAARVASKFTKANWEDWAFPSSLCEFALRIVSFEGFGLTDNDSMELHKLQQSLMMNPEYADLFQCLKGCITWAELQANHEEKMEEWK